jgi:predicted RNase H-like nuclease (RuvC/YqgF family)
MEDKIQDEKSLGMQDEQSLANENGESQENANAVSVEDLSKRLELLERTNDRLLNENKKYKSGYQELKSSIQEEKKAQLVEQENWKELLDIEKKRAHDLESKLQATKKNVLKERLHFEVARHAKDAFDIQDVINAIPKDMISIDEESLSVEGVSDAIMYVKEKKGYLFDNKVKSGQPSGRPSAVTGKVSYDQLSKQEQDELFRKALAEGGFVK